MIENSVPSGGDTSPRLVAGYPSPLPFPSLPQKSNLSPVFSLLPSWSVWWVGLPCLVPVAWLPGFRVLSLRGACLFHLIGGRFLFSFALGLGGGWCLFFLVGLVSFGCRLGWGYGAKGAVAPFQCISLGSFSHISPNNILQIRKTNIFYLLAQIGFYALSLQYYIINQKTNV